MLFLYLNRLLSEQLKGLRLLSIDSDSEVQLGPDEQLDAATVGQQEKKALTSVYRLLTRLFTTFKALG